MLIVTMPVVQLLSIAFASAHLTLELVPACRKLSIYRSWALRIVTYTIQAFLTSLFYQGTNAAIYTTIALIAYIMAQVKGEEVEEAKEQRGRGGGGSGGEKA
ncbi:hypothetical protein FRC20_002465 [Serendipita sp. 405]|nr:hypothetical protein FRC15_002455 [Serendipita sp. 397]KAG8848792.1 hypothetical protein FRC20_002465 [Serendipita sp. 405]